MRHAAALCVLLPLVATGEEPTAVELRVAGTAPFDTQGARLFRGGFSCDSDGNVYFIPKPAADPAIRPPEIEPPSQVLRVSADGRTVTRLGLPATPSGDKPSAPAALAVAVDPSGTPHVLTRLGAGEQSRQYIVSFGKDGKHRSRIEVDPVEVSVSRFAVLGSGAILLSGFSSGRREHVRPRLAILRTDGSLVDVALPAADSAAESTAAIDQTPWSRVHHAVPMGDDRVYLLEQGLVYEIASSGEVTGSFRIVPPRRGARLVDAKGSAHRLAAIFQDRTEAVRWISVYDTAGRQLALYGPVRQAVMCYATDGARDRVTLLGGHEGRVVRIDASYP